MIKIRRIVEFCRLSIKLLAFWLTRLTFTEIYNGQYFLFLYVYRLPQCTDSLGVELKLPMHLFNVCFRRGFESRSVQLFLYPILWDVVDSWSGVVELFLFGGWWKWEGGAELPRASSGKLLQPPPTIASTYFFWTTMSKIEKTIQRQQQKWESFCLK